MEEETLSSIESTTAMAKLKEPLLSTDKKGGFRTVSFIIGSGALASAATGGVGPNMILYLTRQYGMQSSAAAALLFFMAAGSDFMPIVAAVLADSYVGRFPMVGFGSIATLLGMVLLWLTTIYSKSKQPNEPPQLGLALLYSSFVLMSIGNGCSKSSSLAFGADQLVNQQNTTKDSNILNRYFGWYYASNLAASVVAVTCIVYIEENMGWTVGFGIPVVLMFMSVVCFFMASSCYIKEEVRSGLLTRFAQVVVASFRNRKVELPAVQDSGSFYCGKGSVFLKPTPKLRFLNKACLMPREDDELVGEAKSPNPWRACTVEQVEELKSLINVLPLWSTGIIMYIALSSCDSFTVLQASTMDRHVTRTFEIPAGSFFVFSIASILVQVPLCTKIIPSLASKLKGRPTRLGLKQRIGTGLVLSIVATSALAVAEFYRRQSALAGSAPVSAMWLVPYFVIMGFGQGFNGIGQNEFYYSELPKTMSSVASTLFGLGVSSANLVSSLIVSTIQSLTENGGHEGWLSTNIDKGHYDYFYWVISGLSLANFGYFLVCCRAYGPCKEDSEETLH